MGIEKPISGHVSLGQHSILPNYFEQNQVRRLPPVQPFCMQGPALGTLPGAAYASCPYLLGNDVRWLHHSIRVGPCCCIESHL